MNENVNSTDVETVSDQSDSTSGALPLEVGHIIWYLQKGRQLEDPNTIHDVWAKDCPEMQELATQVIQQMYERGIRITYYDRELSHFGKS
ncbi:MAG: hypothetical protein ABJO67_17365 [Pseudoruegeria sp.]